MTTSQYLSVQALTKYLKRKFDADPYLVDIHVKGEISNFKQHSSGHMYFTLKDNKSRILAVMFSSANRTLKFQPENGMNVLVRGMISVYEGSGQYQIYVKEMQPDGFGALYLAYEQLKEKLEQQGYFATERKRPIPAYPQVIGVITSPTGAAVRDIITTIKRRYPMGKIILHPALVQGENASKSITSAIKLANQQNKADVLIVGRGGGSIEELWAFNEELVAKAIYHSSIPVISAVGHETDFTIADFVADLRAPTPTGAAELAVPHVEEMMERLLNRKSRLISSMSNKIRHDQSRLEYIERSFVFKNPNRLYEQKSEQLDRMNEKLDRLIKSSYKNASQELRHIQLLLERNRPSQQLERGREKQERLQKELMRHLSNILKEKKQDFARNIMALKALNPLQVMERGYSLSYTQDDEIIKSVDQTSIGDSIRVMISNGELFCRVEEIKEDEKNG